MSDGSMVTMPTARLTIEYGLDTDGEGIIAETWENLTDPDEDVPMIIKAVLLSIAQQGLAADMLGADDD